MAIRNCIQTIYKRSETNETEIKEMRPKGEQAGREQGLPKIHKKVHRFTKILTYN